MYPDHVLRWKLEKSLGQDEIRITPAIIPFGDVSEMTFQEPADAIRVLEATISALKKAPVPSCTQEDIDKLPPIGSQVWAIKKWGNGKKEPLEATVTEYSIVDDRLCVVIGFYYKPHNEVWETEQEARAFMDTEQ